jgi:hypothetical protein
MHLNVMTETMYAKELASFLTDGREISLVEMGSDDINVFCTQGKINLWLGRQVSEPLIRQVIFGISNVDPSVSHELEIICNFDTISMNESLGYKLISYSKTKGGYRAVFKLSFSKKFALDHFVRSILDHLKEKGVKLTLHWDGSPGMIIHLYNELKKHDGMKIKRIEYKDLEEKRE